MPRDVSADQQNDRDLDQLAGVAEAGDAEQRARRIGVPLTPEDRPCGREHVLRPDDVHGRADHVAGVAVRPPGL